MSNRLNTLFPCSVARWLGGAISTAILAALALLAYGPGALGYDASWALLWGDDVWHGRAPAYEAPGAPTPHPLLNAVCVLLAPLGGAADEALVVLTAIAFALLVRAGFMLGTRLFSVPVGLVFAAILLTRPTLGGEMAQALVDIPYLALVVSAAATEAARRRAGWPVLVQLALAGLLRPEGWLLAAAYTAYLLPALGGRARLAALALGAAGPLLWAATDLLVTGDPFFSLHTTRDLADQLNRPRDVRAAVDTAPQYLESVLGTSVALVGLAGCVLAVILLYERALLPLAILALGLLAFLALGIAGLPILTRYLLVPGVLLALFCAVVVAGWTAFARGDPWRRRLAVLGAAAAVAVAAGVPADVRQQDRFQGFTDGLARAQSDLERAVRDEAVRPLAATRPMRTTDHRAVPLLALLLDRPARAITAIDWGPSDAPLTFAYTDRLDAFRLGIPRRVQPELPDAGRVLYAGRTWTVYLRDPERARSRSTRNRAEREVVRLPAESSAVSVSR